MSDKELSFVFNADVWIKADSYAEAQEIADEIMQSLRKNILVDKAERDTVEDDE